jgi:hypothetical protein
MQGPEREQWIEADFGQLDKHHSYGMYGCSIPRTAVPKDAKVVHPLWNFSKKRSGERKAIKCMDGKQCVRMGATLVNTYSTCMEQLCLHLLWPSLLILVTSFRMVMSQCLYAHASAQGIRIYISMDEVFHFPSMLWYVTSGVSKHSS